MYAKKCVNLKIIGDLFHQVAYTINTSILKFAVLLQIINAL